VEWYLFAFISFKVTFASEIVSPCWFLRYLFWWVPVMLMASQKWDPSCSEQPFVFVYLLAGQNWIWRSPITLYSKHRRDARRSADDVNAQNIPAGKLLLVSAVTSNVKQPKRQFGDFLYSRQLRE